MKARTITTDAERHRALAEMHELVERAKAGRRELTPEEGERFQELDSALGAFESQTLADLRGWAGRSRGRLAVEPDPVSRDSHAAQMVALRGWLLAGAGERVPAEAQRAADDVGVDLTGKNFRFLLPSTSERRELERRAQSTTTTAGGYAVPDASMGALEQALKNFSGVRQAGATILRTSTGADLPIPQVDDTSNKGAILAENTPDSEQDITFGQLVLGAYKYTSKMIRCSIEFLQDNAIDADAWIGRVLGERIGRITNEHFTTGDGSTEPDGLAWSATLGKTFASATAVTYSELVDVVHSVDPAYRIGPSVGWMFNDTTLGVIRKLTDDQSRPLFQPDPRGAGPATILGYPFTVNPDMPSVAAGQHSILFGDFSRYIVRDVREVMLMRLVERYADYAQVGFVAFSRHDGALNDAGQGPIKFARHPAS